MNNPRAAFVGLWRLGEKRDLEQWFRAKLTTLNSWSRYQANE